LKKKEKLLRVKRQNNKKRKRALRNPRREMKRKN